MDGEYSAVEWETKNLGDICENLDSKRVPVTQSSRKAGIIPYYGASGIVDYVADYIFDEDLLLVSEDGANLLARTYPIAFSIRGKAWVNNHAHVLRFAERTTQSFVEYYLNSISLEPYVSGMAQPKLNQKSLNSINILIPPIPEQKRIVAIVDQAFEGIDRAIANTEKNLTNTHKFFESYLNSIFTQRGDGWIEKRLGDIATFRNGLNFTKNSKGESIKIVGVKDFQNNFWIHEDQLDSVTLDGDLKEIDILRKGDILTVRSNGNKELIGRCVLVGELSAKTSHSGFTIRIRIEREDIHLPFIVHFLKSRELRKQLVLDFLNLSDRYLEKDLEDAILREIEQFLLELGAGFTFIARQKRLQIDNDDFYIDLLFYNRKLKRLIAIELKLGNFRPEYKSQMELYLRWLAKYEQESDELPPLGIILCAGKKQEQIELLELDKSGIHVAEYLTVLPPKEVLQNKLHEAIVSARHRLQASKDEPS
ncbi:PDDEXK nuclease domain-containing protein [Phormidesmis priestleyi]|uniref:PDDEXK nuclease domain-containing protein n=1 Tax=Phormidesmis priestleyi TaxID=268141 RepID=UPI001FD19B35|nr:PDDEXK nuclease domain-containing protein [Phormidesmis priestleyi]